MVARRVTSASVESERRDVNRIAGAHSAVDGEARASGRAGDAEPGSGGPVAGGEGGVTRDEARVSPKPTPSSPMHFKRCGGRRVDSKR